MRSEYVVEQVLASAVAAGGTFTVGYPAGTSRGTFLNGSAHKMLANNALFTCPTNFTISFGTTTATITYNGTTTLPAGTKVRVQLDAGGGDELELPVEPAVGGIYKAALITVDLGSPIAIDDDGICASQNRTGAGAMLINGALASGGVVSLDVPRNVIADSGGADTAVITVTGTDVYGNVMKESITLNGTTAVPGKKAFKTITAVDSSATTTNGFFLGTGDVLGLPVHVPATAQILAEFENGAAATAGTKVAGLAVTTKSTATTADVRGTYDPNSACDGSKGFRLLIALEDEKFLGVPQFAG